MNQSIVKAITCIKYIISTLAYAIFKKNSSGKFNKRNYRETNLKGIVRQNIMYYQSILEHVDEEVVNSDKFGKTCAIMKLV